MLIQNMDNSVFEHILVCSFDYSREDYFYLHEDFIQIEMCNSLSIKKDFSAIKQIRKLIKSRQPDLIYCHSSKAGAVGRLANIGLNVPVFYNPHGWAFNMKVSWVKRSFYLFVERVLAFITDKYIVISNYEKLSAIEKSVCSGDKVKVIFNGIDLDMFTALSGVTREQLHISSDAYIIGMVGRISRQKAPDIFVQAAAEIKKYIPNAHFIIVGDGDQRHNIELLISKLGLTSDFTITGWVDNPLDFVSLFDQAILVSRWEGFGLVLAEYMKLAKPIIATKVDAIPDLITDHDNGLLIDVDNKSQLLKAVLSINQDELLRNKLVVSSLKRVDAFFDIKRVALEHKYEFLQYLKHV
jgi:glycosyltransferase involved in cell wall biosynthesis